MVDGQLLSRLGALAMRERWVVGLAVNPSRRRLTAALVAAEGRGLAARVEVLAHLQARLPRDVRRSITRLESDKLRDPAASRAGRRAAGRMPGRAVGRFRLGSGPGLASSHGRGRGRPGTVATPAADSLPG